MSDIEESFTAHSRFERVDGAWTPVTNDWDAAITVEDDVVDIRVDVPMLDAVVENEPVAPVVEDGWFETLALRLEDVTGVTYAEVSDVSVERDTTEVTVQATLEPRPGKTVEDTLAVVNYVEGTWFEGVIPGYDYVEKVESMREQAQQHAQDGPGGGRSGTPL